MWNFYKRVSARTRKFSNNEDGASAVEFALVALPFFALVFGIVELAIIFFISSTLNHAVSETGRFIRVGNFQNCGGGPAFKALICENMSNLGQCTQNLTVDVISQPEFKQITLPPLRELDEDENGVTTAPSGSFNDAEASAPVVIQATFYYRLALPPELTRLETIPGTGIRVLKSTTAFRTEPFPPSTACPPPPATNGPNGED